MSTSTDRKTDNDYAYDLINNHFLPTKCFGETWMVYANGTWSQRPRDIYRPHVLKLLSPGQRTAAKERAVLNLVEGLCQVDRHIFRGAYYKDDDKLYFNVRNGILEVTQSSLKLTEHRQDAHFTKAFDVDYDAKATCPLYEKTLKQALPDEADRNVLQLCFGNFLLPDSRFHTVLVCYGESGCGKSTIADPIAAMFGHHDNGLITNLSLAQICDPKSYATANLLHASVNLSTELQGLEIPDSGIFKQLVFGESIPVREIFGSPFIMKSTCKLWFLSNNLPQFRNGTQAESNRIKFIRFSNKPKHEDQKLIEKLGKERSGIFNYMLSGLQRLMLLPKMPDGGAASQHTATRFKNANDPIGSFIDEYCAFDSEATVEKDTLKAVFIEYIETHNFNAKMSDYFFTRLYDRFPGLSESKRSQPNGIRIRIINGLRLKEPPEPEIPTKPLDMTPIG